MSRVRLAALVVFGIALSPVLPKAPEMHVWLAQSFGDNPDSFPIPSDLPEAAALRVDGSTSMQLTNEVLQQRFAAQFPEVEVQLAASRTDEAIAALIDGEIDLVASGRPLTESEVDQGLVAIPLEREKLAIIVGPGNEFSENLTFEQFAQIFRGEITNWSDVGGPDLPIRFVDRPDYSDTRRALSTYTVFEGQPFETGATADPASDDETDVVVAALGEDGIGYAVVSQVIDRDDVQILSMHQTLPDDPRYPYSQYRAYVYREDAVSPAAVAFLGFATTPPGQEIFAEAPEATDTDADGAETAEADAPAADSSDDETAAVPPDAASPEAAGSDELAENQETAQAPEDEPTDEEVAGGFPWWLLLLLGIPLVGALLWWLLKGSGSTTPISDAPAGTATDATAAGAVGAAGAAEVGTAQPTASTGDAAIAATPSNGAISPEASAPAAGLGAVAAGGAALGAAGLAAAARKDDAETDAPATVAPDAAPVGDAAETDPGAAAGPGAVATGGAALGAAGLAAAAREDDAETDAPATTAPDAAPVGDAAETDPGAAAGLGAVAAGGAALGAAGLAAAGLAAAAREEDDTETDAPATTAPDAAPVGDAAETDPGAAAGLGAVAAGGAALGAAGLAAAAREDDAETDAPATAAPDAAPVGDAAETDPGAAAGLGAVAAGGAALGAAGLAGAAAALRRDGTAQIIAAGDGQTIDVAWTIPAARLEEIKLQGGDVPQIRLYDTSERLPGAPLGSPALAVGVAETDTTTTLSAPAAGRSYAAEVGYLTADRRWLPIAISDSVSVGPAAADADSGAPGAIVGGAAALDATDATESPEAADPLVLATEGDTAVGNLPAPAPALSAEDDPLEEVPVGAAPDTSAATAAGLGAAIGGLGALAAGMLARDGDTPAPGEGAITLLPKTASEIEARWRVPATAMAAAKAQGGQQYQLRVYDVTAIDLDNQPAHRVDIYPCDEAERTQAVAVPLSDRDYLAEIGYTTGEDGWLSLARSTHIFVPADAGLAAGLNAPDPLVEAGEGDAADALESLGTLAAGAALGGLAAAGVGSLAGDLDTEAAASSIVLLPRTPSEAEARWSVPAAAMAAAKAQGGQQYQLRIYDVTAIDLDTQHAHGLDIYPCSETEQTRTVLIPQPDRDYLAEIGYVTEEDVWLKLARSTHIFVPGADAAPDADTGSPADSAFPRIRQGTLETVVARHRSQTVILDGAQAQQLQSAAVNYPLEPGLYLLKIRQGVFNYDGDYGHPGEPFVLLWFAGGTIVNYKTGVHTENLWTTLNGYADTLTLAVESSATLYAFFVDTFPEDNAGEVTLSVIKL